MTHSFDIAHAQKYGLNESIMIHNFQFWIAKNRANKTHNHDGHTWTYNSVKAFEELFPYLKPSQIRRCLESLIEQGVLVKGEYNKNPYDRTSWYAFNDESLFLDKPVELSNLTNGDSQSAISITDTKPYSKPYREGKTSLPTLTIEERKIVLRDSLAPHLEKYGKEMLNNFYAYWIQMGEGDKKMKFEKEKTWDVRYRLSTWIKIERVNKYSAAPSVRPAVNTSAMMNQDNHSNYADYLVWCKKNNVSPEPESI